MENDKKQAMVQAGRLSSKPLYGIGKREMLKRLQIEILFVLVPYLLFACTSTGAQSDTPVNDNQSDLNSPAITNSPVQLQPSTDVEPADVHRDDGDFKVIELTRAAEDLQDSQRLQSQKWPGLFGQ